MRCSAIVKLAGILLVCFLTSAWPIELTAQILPSMVSEESSSQSSTSTSTSTSSEIDTDNTEVKEVIASDDHGSALDDQGSTLNVSDAIAVDDLMSFLVNKIESLIGGSNLDQGIIQKLIMTLIVLFVSVVIFLIVRMLIKKLEAKSKDYFSHIGISRSKTHFYFNLIRTFFYFFIVFSMMCGCAIAWDLPIVDWLGSDIVATLIGSAVTLFVILFIGSVLLELVVAVVERAFHRWGGDQTARVNTLLPIAKNVVYIVFLVIFVLMALSEIGINVMPLMAGAGVVGFAVGFGAQTLIKDLLTGFIIILEDLIQVGDVARLAGRAGLVEKITIRKVQLRDLGGIVYTIPFSEIAVVENLTKDFSYYIFDFGVAYRENVDDVIEILHAIDEEIRKDDNFKHLILEPLDVFGLDQFADSAIIIKARIKTKPIQQWTVGREYNRRVKIAFDKHGVEIPFPHQTIYFGEDKDGKAPPMRIKANKISAAVNLADIENDDDDKALENKKLTQRAKNVDNPDESGDEPESTN